jgi:hypothetical protein
VMMSRFGARGLCILAALCVNMVVRCVTRNIHKRLHAYLFLQRLSNLP